MDSFYGLQRERRLLSEEAAHDTTQCVCPHSPLMHSSFFVSNLLNVFDDIAKVYFSLESWSVGYVQQGNCLLENNS